MSHETTADPIKPSVAKRNNSKMTQLQMLCSQILNFCFIVILTNSFVAKCVLVKA